MAAIRLWGRKSQDILTTRPVTYDPLRGEMTSVIDELIESLGGVVNGLSARGIWKSQPNVRAVVEFLAHNLGQLGVHNFARRGESDRARVRDSAAARLLSSPAPVLTGFDLVSGLVADLLLYDEALWLVLPADSASGWVIRPVPVSRIVSRSGSRYSPSGITFSVRLGDGDGVREFGRDRVVYFGGYSTDHDDRPTPRVETLRAELQAQIDAATFRAQMWRNGLRVSQVVTRPAGKWSLEARSQFLEDLRSYANSGTRAGRPLLLEDGMTLNSAQFSSKDAQWLEATQLSLQTVCRVFQVNPAMVGSTGGVTYANVREFRKMLYGETLGPIVARIEGALNAFLLPMVGADPSEYVEFNIKEKLSGSFEEEAAVLSKSTGVPWMLRNEARATQNLPALPGGDELVTPLNYQVGSGRDDSKAARVVRSKAARVAVKAEAPDEATDAVSAALAAFFARQASVLAGAGVKAPPGWWDAGRWDAELADELYRVAMLVTAQVGAATLAGLGAEPDLYDAAATRAFLTAVAKSRAEWINAATMARVEAVLSWSPGEDETEADRPTVAGVFEDAAKGRRHSATVGSLVTTFAGFAAVEAAKRYGASDEARGEPVKTWDTGPNPRPAHAAMSGETVPVRDRFSNGADWPGDPVLGADGVAGCNCSVTITTP